MDIGAAILEAMKRQDKEEIRRLMQLRKQGAGEFCYIKGTDTV
jgi:GH25 family lysozyme M1 (1,4-beta-N-acetylmuramidase)